MEKQEGGCGCWSLGSCPGSPSLSRGGGQRAAVLPVLGTGCGEQPAPPRAQGKSTGDVRPKYLSSVLRSSCAPEGLRGLARGWPRAPITWARWHDPNPCRSDSPEMRGFPGELSQLKIQPPNACPLTPQGRALPAPTRPASCLGTTLPPSPRLAPGLCRNWTTDAFSRRRLGMLLPGKRAFPLGQHAGSRTPTAFATWVPPGG